MPGQVLPSVTNVEIVDRVVRSRAEPYVQGQDAVLDASVRDPGSSRPTLIRPGTVIVRAVGTHKFVVAGNPVGAGSQPASVLASEAADGQWPGTTIGIAIDGGVTLGIQLGTSDDDNAAVIAALNAHPIFAAHCIADEDQGFVRIRTRFAGADRYIHVHSSLGSAFGQAGIDGVGRDGDYRVTEDWADIRDAAGNPVDTPVTTSLVGFYKTTNLVALTAEARAVLSRRGSQFE